MIIKCYLYSVDQLQKSITHATFNGRKLAVPHEVMVKLNSYQKFYLTTCLDRCLWNFSVRLLELDFNGTSSVGLLELKLQ